MDDVHERGSPLTRPETYATFAKSTEMTMIAKGPDHEGSDW
jgi:hypothetical protein